MTLKDNFSLGLNLKPDYNKIIRNSAEIWGTVDADAVKPQLEFAIYVYANLLVRDIHCDPMTTGLMVRAMENLGLPEFISQMSRVYSESLHRQVFAKPSGIHPDIAQFVDWLAKSDIQPEHWRVACSFLKRFTVNSVAMKEKCLRGFVDVDNRNKVLDRENASNFREYIDRKAKKYITWLLGDFDSFAGYVGQRLCGYDVPITSHAVSHGCKIPFHRYILGFYGVEDLLLHLGVREGELRDMLCWDKDEQCERGFFLEYDQMIPWTRLVTSLMPWWGQMNVAKLDVNVSAVPKDVSKYRIVSPEVPERLSMQKIFNDYIKERIYYRNMEDNLPLWDQEKMRDLCKASVAGEREYSTIDESSASDTVRKTHIRSLFDTDWAEFLIHFAPQYYTVEIGQHKTTRRLHMFSPMGSADTLLIETLVFWAYDCASSDFATRYIPNSRKKLGSYRVVEGERIYPFCSFAMGDDQQVLTVVAETVLDIQQMLGFMPNVEKSFYDQDHLFRESCGVEYLSLEGEVINVNNPYFPRRVLKFQKVAQDMIPISDDFRYDHTGESTGEWNNSLTSCISLAKRLYEAGYPVTSELIQRWLYLHLQGTLTSSPVGAQTSDLWLGEIARKPVTIPMGAIRHHQRQRYGYDINNLKEAAEEALVRFGEAITDPIVVFPVEGEHGTSLTKWRLNDLDPSWDRGTHWSVGSKRRRIGMALDDRPEGIGLMKREVCPICAAELEAQKLNLSNRFVDLESVFMNVAYYFASLRKTPTDETWIDPRDQYICITEPTTGYTF